MAEPVDWKVVFLVVGIIYGVTGCITSLCIQSSRNHNASHKSSFISIPCFNPLPRDIPDLIAMIINVFLWPIAPLIQTIGRK